MKHGNHSLWILSNPLGASHKYTLLFSTMCLFKVYYSYLVAFFWKRSVVKWLLLNFGLFIASTKYFIGWDLPHDWRCQLYTWRWQWSYMWGDCTRCSFAGCLYPKNHFFTWSIVKYTCQHCWVIFMSVIICISCTIWRTHHRSMIFMRHTWWCCWYLFSKGHLWEF